MCHNNSTLILQAPVEAICHLVPTPTTLPLVASRWPSVVLYLLSLLQSLLALLQSVFAPLAPLAPLVSLAVHLSSWVVKISAVYVLVTLPWALFYMNIGFSEPALALRWIMSSLETDCSRVDIDALREEVYGIPHPRPHRAIKVASAAPIAIETQPEPEEEPIDESDLGHVPNPATGVTREVLIEIKRLERYMSPYYSQEAQWFIAGFEAFRERRKSEQWLHERRLSREFGCQTERCWAYECLWCVRFWGLRRQRDIMRKQGLLCACRREPAYCLGSHCQLRLFTKDGEYHDFVFPWAEEKGETNNEAEDKAWWKEQMAIKAEKQRLVDEKARLFEEEVEHLRRHPLLYHFDCWRLGKKPLDHSIALA